jgi:hypothetical protein
MQLPVGHTDSVGCQLCSASTLLTVHCWSWATGVSVDTSRAHCTGLHSQAYGVFCVCVGGGGDLLWGGGQRMLDRREGTVVRKRLICRWKGDATVHD